MAKKGSIHQNYKELRIICSDNSEFVTRSTFHAASGAMRLEIDPLSHPAWNSNLKATVTLNSQADKFNSRFGMNLLGS